MCSSNCKVAYSFDVITAHVHSHQWEIMFVLCFCHFVNLRRIDLFTSYLSFWPRDRADIREGKFASFEDKKIGLAR